jgi:hypothetical protein
MSNRNLQRGTKGKSSTSIARKIARRTREQAIAAHRAIRNAERNAGIYVFTGEITNIRIPTNW